MKSLLFSLALCSAIFAQQDAASITGQVTDPTGLAVTNAVINVTNRETNVRLRVETGADGLYVATPLRIGTYTVDVEAKGFKKTVRDGIPLRVQDRLRLDFRLEVGDLTQTIEVSAEAPLLQSESTSLGQVIATRPVSELPLNGRNFIQLIALSTGAYIPQRNNSLYQDFLIGINGNRIQNNNFLLDGVNNNTTDNNQAPFCRVRMQSPSSRSKAIYCPQSLGAVSAARSISTSSPAQMNSTARCLSSCVTTSSTPTISSMLGARARPFSRISLEAPWAAPFACRDSTTDATEASSLRTIRARAFVEV